MWSSRNVDDGGDVDRRILDHWDMWSSRNGARHVDEGKRILDHWDVWSSRNRGCNGILKPVHFRSLGYVV